jgi:hypothetical protein
MSRRPIPIVYAPVPVSVDAEVAELRMRVGILEQIVAESRADRRPRSRADVDALIVAIAAAVGDRAFTSHDVIVHADTDPELRCALDAARVRTARQLGRRLRGFEHNAIGIDGDVRLTRIGVDRDDSIIWRLWPV